MRSETLLTTTLPAPALRWEPCSSFADDPSAPPGLCHGCGWPADDHDPGPGPALVLPMPPSVAVRLPRAS